MKEIKEILLRLAYSEGVISLISFISAGLKICSYVILSKNVILSIMKLFRIPNAEKLGNFLLTVITAFVSTFLMQSCMKF